MMWMEPGFVEERMGSKEIQVGYIDTSFEKLCEEQRNRGVVEGDVRSKEAQRRFPFFPSFLLAFSRGI